MNTIKRLYINPMHKSRNKTNTMNYFKKQKKKNKNNKKIIESLVNIKNY
jgi:hypothetical protein